MATKNIGEKVVVVAGGYDPFHEGHKDSFVKSAQLGRLVVITHRDESMVLKKGYCYQSLGERVKRLYQEPEVSLVVVAKDTDGTVRETLRELRPDIYAKGGDRVPGSMDKGEVEVCAEIGCRIVYGVGDLLNSSRRIVDSERAGTTTIIVPAFNEQASIANTIEGLLRLGLPKTNIIVVNDGSSDSTAGIVGKYSVGLINKPVNKGKGSALLTGIDVALGDNIIWIDSDDTYPVDIIPWMVQELNNGYGAVVCSRVYGRDNIPKFHRVGLWLFRVLIQGVYGFTPSDPCTGLYGVKRNYLLDMNLTAKRFAIEPEVSMKSARMGIKTLDLPIEYKVRTGNSKLNGVVVGFEDMMMIARLVFWRPKS